MSESELLHYLTQCQTLHGHRCTKSNLYDLRKRLIAAIATPNCETRLALAEAFGRCASSAPPVISAEASRRDRKFSVPNSSNGLAAVSELAEAGV